MDHRRLDELQRVLVNPSRIVTVYSRPYLRVSVVHRLKTWMVTFHHVSEEYSVVLNRDEPNFCNEDVQQHWQSQVEAGFCFYHLQMDSVCLN